jgi:hypothetical protein
MIYACLGTSDEKSRSTIHEKCGLSNHSVNRDNQMQFNNGKAKIPNQKSLLKIDMTYAIPNQILHWLFRIASNTRIAIGTCIALRKFFP